MVTFNEARTVAVQVMRLSSPLPNGGVYTAARSGWEDESAYLVMVGDSRFIDGGDRDYVMDGAPAVLVAKADGAVSLAMFQDHPDRLNAMREVTAA